MAKDPSMPFYVNDWLSSSVIACMTLEQQGAYLRLLCHCWASQSASLPNDDEQLSRLSGMNEGWFANGSQMVRQCFEPHPNQPSKLTNKKLFELWEERQEWKRKSAAAGVKSGESRRKRKPINENGHEPTFMNGSQMVRTKREPNTNSSSLSLSSSLSSSSKEEKTGLAAQVCLQGVNPSDVVIAWNRCPGLVPAHRVTAKRKTAVAARSRDPEWVANWEAGIVKAAASDFCCGSGSTGWRADLDWFLKPDTLTKLLEGKYDNSKNGNGNGRGPDIFANLRDYRSGREESHDGS